MHGNVNAREWCVATEALDYRQYGWWSHFSACEWLLAGMEVLTRSLLMMVRIWLVACPLFVLYFVTCHQFWAIGSLIGHPIVLFLNTRVPRHCVLSLRWPPQDCHRLPGQLSILVLFLLWLMLMFGFCHFSLQWTCQFISLKKISWQCRVVTF